MRLDPTDSAPWWHSEFSRWAGQLPTQSNPALDRATTLLAAHRSELVTSPADVDGTVEALDELSSRCGSPSFDFWHRLLWIELGLSGNGIEYHDVRNSFLPDVLERRIGIPISISVVAMEVGRRLGLPVFGVGMPGHFLVGYGQPDRIDQPIRYVDPFNGGSVLDVDGAHHLFENLFGPDRGFSQDYLAPAGPEEILIRMCANLKQNYARAQDIPGLCDIMRLRTCLPDVTVTEGRELVRLLHATGLTTDALAVCDQIERHVPSAHGLVDHERDRIIAQFN